MPYLTVVPAYGRDYKSKKEIQADFDANKDFIIADMSHPADGKPTNREDLLKAKVRSIMVRYARKTKISSINVV